MDFNSEAGFLQSSFVEFVKCWSMGTSSTFHVESRNGQAFLNFSAFLGPPRNVHFYDKQSKNSKSERKAQRDRERAELYRDKINESTSSTASNSSSSTPVVKMKEKIILSLKEKINVDVNLEDASDVNESDFSNELQNSDVIDNNSTSSPSNDAIADATQNAGDDNDQDQVNSASTALSPPDNDTNEPDENYNSDSSWEFETEDRCQHSYLVMCDDCKERLNRRSPTFKAYLTKWNLVKPKKSHKK